MEKLILPTDVKAKCRVFQEAVYNYCSFLKNQVGISLDSISRSILNRLSSPYIYQEGFLGLHKKLKAHEYKKLTHKELSPFLNFVGNIDR